MQIGILGTGRMAQGLGRVWAQSGHAVLFGSRDATKAEQIASQIGAGARGGSYADAAGFGEVVVLTAPWPAAEQTLRAAGSLAGKVLIDVVNPLQDADLALGHTTSAAEQIAAWAPGARVVKAFNTIYFQSLDARAHPGDASAFFCGDDPAAKQLVAQLAADLGFDPVDAGPLVNARLLEPLALLWIRLAGQGGYGPQIAFKLLRG